MRASTPAVAALHKRDTTAKEYCKQNNLAYGTFIAAANGSNPTKSIVKWLAQNDPEIFNLLPDKSRSILNAKYHGCNQPNHKKGGLKSWLQRG